MIHPAPPLSLPRSPLEQGNKPPEPQPTTPTAGVVYRLAPSRPLPAIDCSKTLRDHLFGRQSRHHHHEHHGSRRRSLARRVGAGSFALASMLLWAFPFYDHRMGQWLAIASTVLHIPAILSAYLRLRFDMAALLVRTYEFWYFTIVNVLGNVLVCCQVGDLRVMAPVLLVFLYEFALLLDANYHRVRTSVLASAIGGFFVVVFLICEAIGVVRDVRAIDLFTYGRWTVEATDVIVNCTGSVAVVLLRNAYRKHVAISEIDRDHAAIRCITFRSKVKLAVVHSGSRRTSSRLTPLRASASTTTVPAEWAARSQIRMVRCKLRFHANAMLWDILPRVPLSNLVRRLWLGVGYTGALATVLSMAIPRDHPAETTLHALALALTLSYCLPCIACHNRQLLRLYVWSFDSLFVGLQVLLAHATVGCLFRWNWRCLIVVASWLWMYWVLTLDLLTPIVKRRLGISMRLAALVLGLQILGQVFLCLELVFLRRWDIADRVLVDFAVGHRTVAVRAIPFLLSRLFTMFWWSWRLLFRLWRRGEDELLMIHAAVEYDDYDSHRRVRGANRRAEKRHTRLLASGGRRASRHPG